MTALRKRILSVLLLICMVFSILPLNASAEEGTPTITGLTISGNTVIYDEDTNVYIVNVPEEGEIYNLVFSGSNLDALDDSNQNLMIKNTIMGQEGTFYLSAQNYSYENGTIIYSQSAMDFLVGFTIDYSFSNDGGTTWSDSITVTFVEDASEEVDKVEKTIYVDAGVVAEDKEVESIYISVYDASISNEKMAHAEDAIYYYTFSDFQAGATMNLDVFYSDGTSSSYVLVEMSGEYDLFTITGYTSSNEGDGTWGTYIPSEDSNVIRITGIEVYGDTVTFDESTNTYTATLPYGEEQALYNVKITGLNLDQITEEDSRWLIKRSYMGREFEITPFEDGFSYDEDTESLLLADLLINEGNVGYTFGYAFSNDSGTTWSEPVYLAYVEETAPIVITKQPETAFVNLGEKFSLTVEAEGEGLQYQWYYKDKGMSDFAASCVKKDTYSFEMVNFRIGRQYYCKITDAYGNSVDTDVVKSTIKAAITQQPQDVEVEIGEKVVIKMNAAGEDLSYQWYYKNRTGTQFLPSCYTGKTYSMTMAEYCHMREVYCVVTDAYGNTVQTETATISRPKAELQIVTQPADDYADMGEKFTISVEAKGEGLQYQWYYKERNGKTFLLSSVKTAAYSYEMTSYRNGRQYYCVITDMYGNSVQSDVAASYSN